MKAVDRYYKMMEKAAKSGGMPYLRVAFLDLMDSYLIIEQKPGGVFCLRHKTASELAPRLKQVRGYGVSSGPGYDVFTLESIADKF